MAKRSKRNSVNFCILSLISFVMLAQGCSSGDSRRADRVALIGDRKVASDQLGSCRPRENASPLARGRRPHFVFFIHGYRDDGSAFKQFPEILCERFKDQNIRVKMLGYPSLGGAESGELKVYEFAQLVYAQIVSFMTEESLADLEYNRGLPAEERFKYVPTSNSSYSLVGHSQGGMVALNYLNSCFADRMDANKGKFHCTYEKGLEIATPENMGDFVRRELLDNKETYKSRSTAPLNVRNLVTYGTPIWGSPMSNSFQTPWKDWLSGMVQGFPKTQTENLAIGSRTTSLLRVWMSNRPKDLNWTNREWQSPYPSQLRVFNLAGYLGEILDDGNFFMGLGLRQVFKPGENELDMVVAPQEARADFFYNIEGPEGRPAYVGKVDLTNNFSAINAIHSPLGNYLALTDVTDENKDWHPGLIYLTKILNRTFSELEESGDQTFASVEDEGKGKNIEIFSQEEKDKYFMNKISNFTNEFKLITPVGYHRKFVIKDVAILPVDKSIYVTQKNEDAVGVQTSGQNYYSLAIRDNFYQTFYHSGKFKDQYSVKPKRGDSPEQVTPNGYPIDYEAKVFGFEPKKFSLQTLAGHSSYGEFFLRPHLPVGVGSEQIDGKTVVAAIKTNDGSAQVFSLDGRQKLVSEKVALTSLTSFATAVLDRCYAGLRADNSAPASDRDNYLAVSSRVRVDVKHEGLLYQDFADEESIGSLAIGEPVEILGRYATGFMDPTFKMGRGCTAIERNDVEKSDNYAGCGERSIDRYLVTSPKLRDSDSVVKFSNIEIGKGLRWINVVDVDAADKNLPVRGKFNRKTMLPEGTCVRDGKDFAFYRPDQYEAWIYRP